MMFEIILFFSYRFKCTFPRVGLFGAVGVDALAIALLAFALHIRLVNALARKQASVSAVDERQVKLAFPFKCSCVVTIELLKFVTV